MHHYKGLVKPYVLWSFLLIVLPLALILLYSITTGDNSLITIHFTLDNFRKISDPIYLKVFIKSLQMGLITTGVCLILAYPMAYIISKFDESSQNILILLVTIPMWINTLLRTYAWISLLSDNGIINSLFKLLGLNQQTMMYTNFSVVMGLVCDLLPFMVIPIHTSLAKMDHSLVEAASDLGANRFQTFTKVILKLSLPGVINGVSMVFLLSISSFVIPQLLGGHQFVLIGNLIENQFISVGDWNFGSSISVILAVIILAMMGFMKKIDPDENGGN
ncbi:ABC transporter permease [Eubacterium ventriosum]|jgi:spermidine/putrescine transport system permease protein|uniref:ABC transporter permease n=1 Tax=Eubacterium ventriosum TaxID=39496 RepID=UPI002E7694E6|nr:ABC transporter permease [Eubacterium ventriosum]MEE0854500.1 ABC transporter permease [Eubacterium ventriosum]